MPAGCRPYVRVKTTTSSVHLGNVGAYTPTLETDGREIVLLPPLWSARPQGAPEPMAPEWQRLVLMGEDIAVVMVAYPSKK